MKRHREEAWARVRYYGPSPLILRRGLCPVGRIQAGAMMKGNFSSTNTSLEFFTIYQQYPLHLSVYQVE